MDEDEDKVLLSSLGVASANPEDIERSIFAEAKKERENEDGGNGEEEPLDDLERTGSASTSHSKLLNKLRAVDFEIHAVASTVEQAGEAVAADDLPFDGDFNVEKGNKEDAWPSRSGSALQHALATDRLKSLRKTKALLEQELSGLQEAGPSKTVENYKLLQNLVKEEPTKRKLKEVKKPGKREGKKLKTVSFRDDPDFDAALDAASAGFVETERDELVRRGILTPFHKLKGFERGLQRPGPSDHSSVSKEEDEIDNLASGTIAKAVQLMSEAAKARPTTKLLESSDLPKLDAPTIPFKRLRKAYRNPNSSESEVDRGKDSKTKKRRPLPEKKWRKRIAHEDYDLQESEDGPVNMVASSFEEEQVEDVDKIDDHEIPYVLLEGGLKIPESIYSKLFDYQKVGVQWLWELHCQRAGGIIGDEMGLGKTVQVLSFLGSLHFSKMYKPSIVICPVTLLRQWKREARTWYPSFHVEILHDSAQDSVRRKKREKSSESEYDTDDSAGSDHEQKLPSKISNKWDSLIDRVLRSDSGLLITTYEQIRLLGEKLLDVEWGYAVLDEGHRIRNPNTEVTLVCKQLQTVHRVIMTGAPIQNKLTELWSLFDFVFPGKLGVLPVFEAEFAVPITVGGYANASPLQVSTAYRCAVVLRDLIMPYLLRRMKADVNAQLPKKTEHVLFCSLTDEQRSIYRAFLASSEVENILDGSKNSLYGIDVMRKICNHPDLLEREHSHQNPDYGNPERSGKMKVVEQVLKVWKEQGHRVLFFAQTQQMLDILESFLVAREYSYRRMDGSTPVKHRMALIDEFNNSEEVFVFILTTKVGGLGTNLTGANRVIIFDPDWNPSTDMQARERAWRIGQKKDVTVYRLITRGTIEEKVYHRQIYKHFLTNKILKNPQQRRFFKARDMKDLFTLNDNGDSNGSTETSNIFNQLPENINVFGGDQADDERDKSKNSKVAGKSAADAMEGCSGIKEDAGNRENAEDETNILKCLFDNHGIHSAVNHDAIMDAHVEEKTRLEAQATQVAQRAAEALRQSRMLRSHDSISIPTWTGKSGAAGAPYSVRKKFGSSVNSHLTRSIGGESTAKNGLSAGSSSGKALSSAEVLARIRGNHEKAANAGLEQRPPNLTSVQPEVLIRKICSFIQQSGGRTASSSIVEHFQDRIPAKDLPLFKNLLKEIATLEKDPNGSLWVLKPEYREE